MNGQLTIGQVAKEVGIPAKTIRYYEEIRLLQQAKRTDNGYRKYSKEDITRLRLIKQARVLRLPLNEVKQLVQECLGGSCEHLKDLFLTRLPEYISSIEQRIGDLQELHHQLKDLQNNLRALHLNHPKRKVGEADCCEVLEQIESKVKGGVQK